MKFLSAIDQTALVRLTDKISTSPALEEQLKDTIAAVPRIVLDVQDIAFTSMLIGELVNLSLRLDSQWPSHTGWRVGLINATDSTRNVMELVKLTGRIPIFDTLQGAMVDTHAVDENAQLNHTAAN